jgi:hypothetical protein
MQKSFFIFTKKMSEEEVKPKRKRFQFLEVERIGEIPLQNTFYNTRDNIFYIRTKKKVVVEVDSEKPVKWRTVKNNYKKQDGSVSEYSYKYINLQGNRISEDDVRNGLHLKKDVVE